jgi:hypothetical protein
MAALGPIFYAPSAGPETATGAKHPKQQGYPILLGKLGSICGGFPVRERACSMSVENRIMRRN